MLLAPLLRALDGIDTGDDEPVHSVLPGSDPPRAWCGVLLVGALRLPEPEVTDEAWCPHCITAERLARSPA